MLFFFSGTSVMYATQHALINSVFPKVDASHWWHLKWFWVVYEYTSRVFSYIFKFNVNQKSAHVLQIYDLTDFYDLDWD